MTYTCYNAFSFAIINFLIKNVEKLNYTCIEICANTVDYLLVVHITCKG